MTQLQTTSNQIEKHAMFASKMAHVAPADFKPRERISDKSNPFVLEVDSYKRDIHPVKHAVDQAAWHLHIQTGVSYSPF